MLRFYRAVLSLYPAAYREAFGLEMLEVFKEAGCVIRKRGLLPWLSFLNCEFVGLLKGLVTERAVQWSEREAYISSRSAEAQHEVDYLIRRMEWAIAHHDFARARFYSSAERIARARLNALMEEQN